MQPDDHERIARLERQVSYLLRHLGIDAEDAASGPSADTYANVGPPGYAARPSATGFDAEPAAGPWSGPPAEAIPPQLVALIQRGQLIQAIKMYRKMTGLGLKDAKDAVDAMARDIRLVR